MLGFHLKTNLNKFINKEIKCDDQIVSYVDKTKLLGVTIEKNLKWNFHIDNLCKRISKLVSALRVLKNSVNQDA